MHGGIPTAVGPGERLHPEWVQRRLLAKWYPRCLHEEHRQHALCLHRHRDRRQRAAPAAGAGSRLAATAIAPPPAPAPPTKASVLLDTGSCGAAARPATAPAGELRSLLARTCRDRARIRSPAQPPAAGPRSHGRASRSTSSVSGKNQSTGKRWHRVFPKVNSSVRVSGTVRSCLLLSAGPCPRYAPTSPLSSLHSTEPVVAQVQGSGVLSVCPV